MTDGAEARPSSPSTALRPSSWYALWVLSNAEFAVRDALTGYGIESFLPTWSEVTQWSDRKKTIVRPLFPGYLFARSEGAAPPREILRIRAVIHVLPTNLNPKPIDAAEVENVRRALSSRLPVVPCGYVTGDEVVIDKGALAGVKGTVLRTKQGTRVIVRVEMLQRAVSVEVPASDVLRAK